MPLSKIKTQTLWQLVRYFCVYACWFCIQVDGQFFMHVSCKSITKWYNYSAEHLRNTSYLKIIKLQFTHLDVLQQNFAMNLELSTRH